MATILGKCGITDKVIGRLIKKGLFVPKKVKPVKNPMRSSSEEWFYQVADRFAPPFTKKEREFYIKNPEKFCEHLLEGTKLLIRTCELLYDTSEKAKKLSSPKEAITALLVIQRIIHAVWDYNHMKYDRHLEYHDFEESPVGYYWKKLKKLCLLAAENAKVVNPEEFAKEKMLELISGYGIATTSVKSKKIASEAFIFIVKNLKNKQLEKELRFLVKIIKQFSITQLEEGAIFYEGLPPRNLGAIKGGFHYWSFLITLIKKNSDLIRPAYKNKIDKWLRTKDFPQIFLAAREFVQLDAAPFVQEVQDLYNIELKRWRLS